MLPATTTIATEPTPVNTPDLVVPLVVSLVYRRDPGVVGCTGNYRRANEGMVAAGASTTTVRIAVPGN
jgi:hypothetical protein